MTQVCVNIDANCDECIEVLGDVCFTSLNINTALPSSTSVYLWIRDKFDNLYRVAIMSEYNGSIDLLASDFPEGMFKLPQIFDLFFTSDIAGSTVLPVFADYNCIKLHIQ